MNLDVLGPVLSFACLIVAFVFMVRIRRSKVVYITDYQAGVRFRNGSFDKILPPGGYFSHGSANQITVVDLRPHPFIFERMLYQDVLRAKSVMSVGGEFAVRDPHLAVSTMKDLVNDPLQIVREHLSIAASRTIADSTLDGRKRLAAAITAELNNELQARGVEVRHFEITELWSQTVGHNVPAVAN